MRPALTRLLRRLRRKPQVIDLRDQPADFLLAAHRLAELLPQQRQPNDHTWKEYR